ncbi:MAG: VOC family protein [Candidatus Saccharimonadales bacterium]
MKKIYPLLITDKLKECADFYVEYFGFEKVFEQDWYIQLVHKSGAELAFMVPNAENQPEELHPAFSGKGLVYSFEVEDAEKEYNRLKDTGVKIFYDLTTEEWGQKHFMIIGPAGEVIDVVQQPKGV